LRRFQIRPISSKFVENEFRPNLQILPFRPLKLPPVISQPTENVPSFLVQKIWRQRSWYVSEFACFVAKQQERMLKADAWIET